MVSGKCKQELTKTQKINNIQSSKGEETQATFTFYTNNNMTEKEKALVEALCDAYGMDYPEAEDEDDMRSEEELYLEKESSYEFTS